MDAQVIPKNHSDQNLQQREVLTDTEKLPWPSVKEFERDFKDNGAVTLATVKHYNTTSRHHTTTSA